MSSEWKDGEVRDIDHEMMRLTLQIVAKPLFSADVTDEADEVGAAMTTIVNLFNFLLLPFSEILEKLPLPHSIRFQPSKSEARRDHLRFYRRAAGERRGQGRLAFDAAALARRRKREMARDERPCRCMTNA